MIFQKTNEGDSFVYKYNMPSDIYINETNQINKPKKRNFMQFRKKGKRAQGVNNSQSVEEIKTLKSNQSLGNTYDSRINLNKNSKDKFSLNCCKIS